MNPVYASFYTEDNGYAEEAAQLTETLVAFDLEHVVRPVKNLGGWAENCQQKPCFLRQVMKEYPGRPVVWLDADSRVIQMPFLFNNLECDMAAVWKDGSELLAASIYFAATDAARTLIDEWEAENKKKPWGLNGDQKNFEDVVSRMEKSGRLRTHRMPPTYCQIFDLMRHVGDPVILQTQASRRLRKS